jgi:DNA-directed RNA polymerase specialized sigma24 family protein
MLPDDNDTLRELLRACNGSAEGSPERQAADAALFKWMRVYFDRELRPYLQRVFPRTGDPTSVQYSTLVQEFFTEVLARPDDPFWKIDSTRHLLRHVAYALANDIRDVYRRPRGQQLPVDEATALYDQRRAYWEEKTGVDIASGLGILLDSWRHRGEPWSQYVDVLLARHVDGLTNAEIASRFQLAESNVAPLLAKARGALRISFQEGKKS